MEINAEMHYRYLNHLWLCATVTRIWLNRLRRCACKCKWATRKPCNVFVLCSAPLPSVSYVRQLLSLSRLRIACCVRAYCSDAKNAQLPTCLPLSTDKRARTGWCD